MNVLRQANERARKRAVPFSPFQEDESSSIFAIPADSIQILSLIRALSISRRRASNSVSWRKQALVYVSFGLAKSSGFDKLAGKKNQTISSPVLLHHPSALFLRLVNFFSANAALGKITYQASVSFFFLGRCDEFLWCEGKQGHRFNFRGVCGSRSASLFTFVEIARLPFPV